MNPKGLYCQACRGVRLAVIETRRPLPGVTVRWRRCTTCGRRIKTEERASTRPGRKEPKS